MKKLTSVMVLSLMLSFLLFLGGCDFDNPINISPTGLINEFNGSRTPTGSTIREFEGTSKLTGKTINEFEGTSNTTDKIINEFEGTGESERIFSVEEDKKWVLSWNYEGDGEDFVINLAGEELEQEGIIGEGSEGRYFHSDGGEFRFSVEADDDYDWQVTIKEAEKMERVFSVEDTAWGLFWEHEGEDFEIRLSGEELDEEGIIGEGNQGEYFQPNDGEFKLTVFAEEDWEIEIVESVDAERVFSIEDTAWELTWEHEGEGFAIGLEGGEIEQEGIIGEGSQGRYFQPNDGEFKLFVTSEGDWEVTIEEIIKARRSFSTDSSWELSWKHEGENFEIGLEEKGIIGSGSEGRYFHTAEEDEIVDYTLEIIAEEEWEVTILEAD